MTVASVGVLAKAAIGASNPVDLPLEFITDTVKKIGSINDTNGIRGTRSHYAARTRTGTSKVSGQLVCMPSPVELDYLLYRVMGTAKNGNVFALAETLPEFYYSVDRVAKVPVYAGCKAVKMTFAGSAGNLITVTMDVEGKTESVGASGSFPTLTMDYGPPYHFADSTSGVVINGTTYLISDFELTIDNTFNGDRFTNSLTRTDLPVFDRTVGLKLTLPYTADEVGLHGAGYDGLSASITFTNNTRSCAFTFAALQFPEDSPTIASKDEISMVLNCIARRTASTAELSVSNDSTV